MAKTIVGLYDSFEQARKVQDALVNAGFDRHDVGIVAANSDDRYADFVEDNIDHSNYNKYYASDADLHKDEGSAAEGAIAGGVLGAVGTAIVAVLVPGAGPLTATGWILGGLVGLIGGAITGGILGALVDAGVHEEDAVVYSEGVRRGYSLVTVRVDDGDAAQVASIMNDYDAIDTEERAAYWEKQGWDRESHDKEAPVYSLDQIEAERTGYTNYTKSLEETGTATVPVMEEELVVGKRQRQSGSARVRTYVERERVEEDVTLRKEHIDVDRHRVDREISPSDLDAFEEGVVEVTATSEEAVVGKKARIVEEVTISKGVDQVTERVGDTLRHTEVDVDYDADAGYDDTVYRSHYNKAYKTTGRNYNYYEPFYQYGYTSAGDARYADYSDWNTAETHLRRDYETRYAGSDSTWDDVKDAVRSGWFSVKRAVS